MVTACDESDKCDTILNNTTPHCLLRQSNYLTGQTGDNLWPGTHMGDQSMALTPFT